MKRKYFFQKVHVKAIAGNVGLFIHIPAVMSIITVLVSVILKEPVNAIFEAFSGFTSTGLSMVNSPFDLPKTIQWLRSFQQWIGGVGLIIFVLSLIEPNT